MDKMIVIKLFDVGGVKRELISDASSVCYIVLIFVFGWILDSAAMDWLGFIVALLFILGKGSGKTTSGGPQEIADLLLDKYGVKAKEPDPPE